MLAHFLARMRVVASAVVISAGWLLVGATARAEYALNMTQGVTPISKEVYDLHMIILWICVFVGIGVFGTMFYSIYHHRKSRGAVAAQFHESTKIEVVWTIIPFVILVVMAIPATRVLVAMEDTTKSDVTVKVTGYQWKWQYEYLNDGIDDGNEDNLSFFSSLNTPRDQIYGVHPKDEHYLLEVDNDLVLPVGKKIRILTTANDVIHAWWVPALGWKRDSIPGYINENWAIIQQPGIYRGQCAELCGKDHGFMPIVVRAVAEDDYKKWVAEQKTAKQAQAEAVQQAGRLAGLLHKEQLNTDDLAAVVAVGTKTLR